MALREFTGKLDETPKLKEFTGNLDIDDQSSTLGDIGAAIKSLFSPKPDSVMEGLPPNPAAFDFSTASRLSRKLDDNAQRQKDFGTIGPIIGPKPSTLSIINGLFTDVVAGGKAARAGINQMAGDMAGSEYLKAKARSERGQADLMTAVNTPEFEGDTARAVYGGLSSTARMAPSLAAAVVTKNPGLALGGMVAPMVPDAYGKYRQRGATPGEALLAAASEAGIEYITEKMPMGFLVKNFGRIGAAKMISGFIARDALPEQVATLTQDAIDTAVANPDKTWGDYWAERPSAAYQTLVATGTQAGLMGGANAAMNRLSRSQAPAQSTEPTIADYQAAVQKIFGTAQAPASPEQQAPLSQPQAAQITPAVPAPQEVEQAPQQAIQSLARLIADTASQDSPLNAPKLTPVGDDIQLDKEPVNDGTENVLQPVDSSATGSGALDADTGMVAPHRIRDSGRLDLTGNDASQPTMRVAPLAADRRLSKQVPPATEQPAPNVEASADKVATGYIGEDGASIDEGGKPFATKLAAQKAKKLQPMMRIKKVANGFVLAEKTPAQLAAEEKAAKRIRGASGEAGSRGRPMSAHEFIASRGGMSPSARADLGIEGNIKVGNRWLFAGAGKGMSIAQAAEALHQAGYIKQDDNNTAYELIKRSLSNPQYTDEGWERMAELEMQTQFEDYLASQQDAAQHDDNDPFAPLEESGFTREDADAAGFDQASPELQAEVAALAAQLDVHGMDAEGILERIAVQYPQATLDEYYEHAKDAITQAINEAAQPASSENVGSHGGQQSEAPAASAEQAGQGLTSYTPQDIEDRLVKLEQAEQERKQQEREAEQKAQADAERDNFTLTGSDRPADVAAAQGQQDIFSATPEQQEAQTAPQAGKIEDLGEKIGGARKDTGVRTGRTDKTKPLDDRPAWSRRFDVSEIVSGEGEGRWVIRDTRSKDFMGRPKQVGGRSSTYATEQEALDAIPLAAVSMKHRAVPTGAKRDDGEYSYEIWRDINDRKRVKVVDQVFQSRVAALEYMATHAQEILETNTTFGEADLPTPDNTDRTGIKRRKGDVQGSDVMETFGFRGVEFGNWNNQIERQEVMNAAYDGLMDLAEVMGIPPKAIGLNGDLALAFGARGKGLSGARAHYEQERAVINLTKMHGAGALAHEWFHALDHYFARQDGKASSQWEIAADGTRTFEVRGGEDDMASSGFKRVNSGVRQELRDAYNHVMQTMFKKAEQYVEDTAKADKFVAATRNDVAERLDGLRKALSMQRDVQLYKRHNKPATAEQLAEFDTVANQIIQGEALEIGLMAVDATKSRNGSRWSNEALEKLNAIYKAVRGRTGFDATNQHGVMDYLRGDMMRYSQRLKMLAEAQSGAEKTKTVPTEFAMNAKELDQGRGQDYWTTPHEMAARAFQGYIEDKIAAQGARSPFLNYAPENIGLLTPWGVKRPYPHGKERVAINGAFDAFVSTLKSKETETGVMLFDIPRVSDSILTRLPETVRTNVLAKLKALERKLDAEKITQDQYREGVRDLIERIQARNESQHERAMAKGRERGPEWVTERLMRAKRKGELSEDTVDFALWALAKNPALANDLGISLPEGERNGTAGEYNPASRVMRLFKSSANSTTVVHEILHHTERMMPVEIQNGILKEYQKAYDATWAKADEMTRKLMQSMLAASVGDAKAKERVMQGFLSGALKYEEHYQLYNASEFWAVNATNILSKRYKVEGTWVAKAKRWLVEMMEYIKGALGMRTDAPILRAIKNVMEGQGQRITKTMLNGQYGFVEDIKNKNDQAELDLNKPGHKFEPITGKDAFSTAVDATGRKQWALGKKLYDRMATYATDYLGRVKLADNRPAEFKQMMRQFRVDQNKATESAKAIAEKGMDLTPEQRVLLSDMIENQAKVGDVPPQEMVELAASITAALETQARELVELGMLSEDRLVQNYLPRLYKTPLMAQLTNKQMFMSWFTKTRMKIRGARLQSRGLVNEVPVEKVELAKRFGWKVSSLADGDNLPQNLLDVLNSGGKIPAKYNGTKIVMWRDFTESERQDMGEVRDAVLRYAMGYVETQRDVAIGRLFKAVANNPDLAKTYNPGGWVQVPNAEIKGAPGTKTYGALAGMYVEPQVADSLKRNTQPKGVLMAAYDKALGWWKEGKTVWNPVSHGNNVVSNIFVMHFAGLNPANPANWRNTVREYRTKGQYYKEAVDKGLFGTEWATMEIQNLLMPDLADMADIESVASSRVSKMAEFLKKTGKPVSWYRENMQRAYEFEDQFFKLMIYVDRRKAGMTPEQAIEDTERYVFNYADIPEGVENIKRVYSPFFSYTYKAVPMVLHTAMTRPDRLLAPIALLSGANWLGYLISGGDEDKERKGLPDYMQGRSAIGTQKAVRMPFNVEGKPAFMDVTRRVPLGDLFDVNNQTNGLPVPAPLMPSHPLLSMAAAIAWNVDTFSGKDLVKKSDTAWEAAQTRAGYVYKQLAPNAPFVPGSYNFNKLMDSAAYTFDTELGPYTGRTKAGDPMPMSTTLPDVLTGTKIRAVDPERGIEYKKAALGKELREIQANIRSANRNQSMTADSRERYNQEQRDKLDELRKQREALQ